MYSFLSPLIFRLYLCRCEWLIAWCLLVPRCWAPCNPANFYALPKHSCYQRGISRFNAQWTHIPFWEWKLENGSWKFLERSQPLATDQFLNTHSSTNGNFTASGLLDLPSSLIVLNVPHLPHPRSFSCILLLKLYFPGRKEVSESDRSWHELFDTTLSLNKLYF